LRLRQFDKRMRGTQNNSLRKRRRGAPLGNGNAKKRLPWLAEYDLDSEQGVDGFVKELIKRVWTGELGTRQAGALNGALNLLLEKRQWIHNKEFDAWTPTQEQTEPDEPQSRVEKLSSLMERCLNNQERRTFDQLLAKVPHDEWRLDELPPDERQKLIPMLAKVNEARMKSEREGVSPMEKLAQHYEDEDVVADVVKRIESGQTFLEMEALSLSPRRYRMVVERIKKPTNKT